LVVTHQFSSPKISTDNPSIITTRAYVMFIYNNNFNKLQKIILNLNDIPESSKSKVTGYMDLNLDVLNREQDKLVIALSHYYKHPSGDMIPDPDMTMEVHLANETVEALTYQDIYFYNDVYANGSKDMKVSVDLNRFLSTWLNNLIEQGHILK